jgi:AcrR family transcriptional regulator
MVETVRPGRPSALRVEVAALKRQRILEAAAELFFSQGYAAATLQTLASGMEVTKPFIYSYFTNKTEILAAICETGIDESLAAVAKGHAEADRALDQLRIAMDAGARSVIRFQRYVVVYQRELKSLAPQDAQRILQKRVYFDHQVTRLIERGVAEGSMHVDDPAITSVWIGGLLSWIPVWYNPAGRKDADRVAAEFVAAVDRLVGAVT